MFKRYLLALMLLLVPASVFAQEAKEESKSIVVIDSVTLTPGTVTFVVSEGKMVDGEFQATTKGIKYEIDLNKATMQSNGVKRSFNEYEAVLVNRNIEVLLRYVLDCVGWWKREETRASTIIAAK